VFGVDNSRGLSNVLSGRGGKGQKARSGNMHFEGFEGGQSPLQRRLPKRGFINPFTVNLAVVNVGDLDAKFKADAVVDEKALREAGLVKGRWHGIKILGAGELSKKLTVKAHAFSAKAKEAITKAGGSAEVLAPPAPEAKPAEAKKADAKAPAAK